MRVKGHTVRAGMAIRGKGLGTRLSEPHLSLSQGTVVYTLYIGIAMGFCIHIRKFSFYFHFQHYITDMILRH